MKKLTALYFGRDLRELFGRGNLTETVNSIKIRVKIDINMDMIVDRMQ